MISHSHRCIFVHIPKTAGNSINRIFGIGWQDHKDLQRYRDELPPSVFDGYFKFAVVRNPWDRLLSDYNYQLKKSRPKDSKLFVYAPDGSKRDFAAWVDTAFSDATTYGGNQWGGEVSPHIHRWSPQVDWMSVDGHIGVQFVARLEHLNADFRTVCLRLGLAATSLPHRNRRLHWHYSHYYDHTTRELVGAYYARDVEEFGYEFEDSVLRVGIAWPFGSRRSESDDVRPPATATTVSFARRSGPPSRYRRNWRVALGAACALVVSAIAFTFMSSTLSDNSSRSLVRTAMHRLLDRKPANARSTSRDPLSQLADKASGIEFAAQALPMGTPAFVVMILPPSQPLRRLTYDVTPRPAPVRISDVSGGLHPMRRRIPD